VATARNVDTLSYLSDRQNVLKLSLNITSRVTILQCLSAAVVKLFRIDVVINNVGYALIEVNEGIPQSDI
jgi:NADP-dependent 3-hydroxy acid dehydrogenase YdfG